MTDAAQLVLLVTAACFDWRLRKIPNVLTLSMMGAGLWYQWQAGAGWIAVTGMAGGFVLTVGPVLLRGMGMGDQKLLMAVGAWSSWMHVYTLFLYSVLVGLLVIAMYPRTWVRLRDNLLGFAAGWRAHRQFWLPGLDRTAFVFPYAVLLLGAFVVNQVWGGMESLA